MQVMQLMQVMQAVLSGKHLEPCLAKTCNTGRSDARHALVHQASPRVPCVVWYIGQAKEPIKVMTMKFQ